MGQPVLVHNAVCAQADTTQARFHHVYRERCAPHDAPRQPVAQNMLTAAGPLSMDAGAEVLPLPRESSAWPPRLAPLRAAAASVAEWAAAEGLQPLLHALRARCERACSVPLGAQPSRPPAQQMPPPGQQMAAAAWVAPVLSTDPDWCASSPALVCQAGRLPLP